MELARDYARAKKGINWGKLTFEHLKKKSDARKNCNSNNNTSNNYSNNSIVTYSSTKDNVRNALEDNPLISELNGTKILTELSIDDQCTFFSNYIKCEKLILQDFKIIISDITLRCITIVMSDTLIELDLSNSIVNNLMLEVILSHLQVLKTIKLSNCPHIDSTCMNVLVKYTNHSLKDLYVNKCPLFKIEPLLVISGVSGMQSVGLKKLVVLDFSESPIEDKVCFPSDCGLIITSLLWSVLFMLFLYSLY